MAKFKTVLLVFFNFILCLSKGPVDTLCTIGPYLPYVQLRFTEVITSSGQIPGPILFGFAPGFISQLKCETHNGGFGQFAFRSNYAPNGIHKGTTTSRFKDFDTFFAGGYRFFNSERWTLNCFLGFGYNRMLSETLLTSIFEASLQVNYNTIFLIVGYNHEWKFAKNWKLGLDLAAKPDLNPVATLPAFPGNIFIMAYRYAIEASLSLQYEKKLKKFALSYGLMPFTEYSAYGQIFVFGVGFGQVNKLIIGGSFFIGANF